MRHMGLFFWVCILIPPTLFLMGCCTVHETEAPRVNALKQFDLKLCLKGFELVSLQQTGFSTASGSGTAYNWKTNSTIAAHGSSVIAHYGYCPDDVFSDSVSDMFESLGFNIKSNNPDLTLVGRVGVGGFPWASWGFWLRDAPVFLIAVPTIGMVISCTRENRVELIVYDQSGKRLTSYASEQRYHSFSVGFPFANFANNKTYEWYGDRKAAQFALIDCVNEFIFDLSHARFDKNINLKTPVNGSGDGICNPENALGK